MKVLYIYTTASTINGSVQNKVIAQIDALNSIGSLCRGLFLSTDKIEQSENYPNIDFLHVPKIRAKYFRSSKQKSAYFLTLLNQKLYDIDEFDFVYFRYPGAHPLLNQWLKKHKNKVFFEHVTAETEEIKMYKRENPFEINLSSFLSYLEFYFLPLIREKIYGKSIRNLALFGICNSDDIAHYERKMAGNVYKTLVLGDAVQTEKFPIKKPTILGQEFRMIFLKGAATNADFNGLDRVFHGMKNYKGNYNLKLYLFGKNLESEKKLIQKLEIEEMVICSGFIQQNEVDEILNQMHIGIGALAVHRKGLKSTSTIKTREYCARGLPFIFGHFDTDFSYSDEAQRFCLQEPASDDSIDFGFVISWYQNMQLEANIETKMRDFSLKHLEYIFKMKKLLTFINDNNYKKIN